MTRSPLARACVALRLPAGLYLDRGERGGTTMKDAEIRAALRRQHVATERLALALADVLALLQGSEDASDVWPAANAIAYSSHSSRVRPRTFRFCCSSTAGTNSRSSIGASAAASSSMVIIVRPVSMRRCGGRRG